MSKENKLIPELRFLEFENEGEWGLKTLGEIAEIKRGAASQHLNYVEDKSKGIRLLRINDFLSDTPVYVKDSDDMKRFRVRTNDLLIAGTGATAGITFIVPEEFNDLAYSYNAPRIRLSNDDNFFIYNYLKSDSILNQQRRLFVGNAQPFLDTNAIRSLKISIPKLPEQQKIALCLSSLDDLIAAHNDKLAALKDHKKGLMQNLFPQEDETVPRYRFKEFEDDGEWAEKMIEQVFSIFQGYAFSSRDSVSSGIRWLKIADVGIQEMKNDTPSFLPGKFQKEHKRFLVKKGDYVLALTRPILSGKLKISPVDLRYNNSLLNQRVGKLVTEHNSTFIYYLIQTSSMVKSINSNIAGNEPPNLSFQQISDIKVFIPSEEEQQKIASCLSAVDELITAQAEKIEQLKLHKKGLMQGLFPKIEG